MNRRIEDKILQTIIVITTLVMTILRFLLNEKGRVSPDSIRFMRTAEVFPIIDNTTAPLGYPLSLKLFTYFGIELFWASKIVGILAVLFIIYFAAKKKFYHKETIITTALFSFVSIFSFTLSEALILPFVFLFVYIARQIIICQLQGYKAFFLLSLLLIALFNIRYPAVFFMGATFLFGMLNFKKTHYSKIFMLAGLAGGVFVIIYKLLFINHFNENYVENFLEIGLHPTSKLITEFFQGILTTFNPFIHIANPSGGIINYGIYGVGFISIAIIAYIFIKSDFSESEKFLIFTGLFGIICSFFIQYFYSVDAINYRLLAPFSFPIWLVFFRKLWSFIGKYTYIISILSLLTGLAFIILSHGNYLDNRKAITNFLEEENLKSVPLKFFIENEKELDKIQIAELISTVNPNIKITFTPKDTLQKTTLTQYKVLQKVKIDTNKFQ